MERLYDKLGPTLKDLWLMADESREPSEDGVVGTITKRDPGPQKFDQGKPRLSLLFTHLSDTLDLMAQVLSYGADKYPSVDNFQGHQEKIPEMYLSAALRHIEARCRGEIKDPESGKDHLGHALVSLGFVVWWDSQKKGED